MMALRDPWAEFAPVAPGAAAPVAPSAVPEIVIPRGPPPQTQTQTQIDELTRQLREQELRGRTRENQQAETLAARQQRDITEVQSELRRVIQAARRARRRSAEGWFMTGIGSEWIGGNTTEGQSLRGDLSTIASNVAFDRLARMRAESPTGGALGAITERELDLLRDSIASLNTNQSDADFQRNMDEIINTYGRMYQRVGGSPSDLTDAPEDPNNRGQSAASAGGTLERGDSAPDAPVNPFTPVQQRAWDAFRTANSRPTRAQLRSFFQSINMDPARVNIDQLEEAARTGRGLAPGSEATFGRPNISDVRGENVAPEMENLENVDAFMRGAADVATFGHVDELRAARDTVFGDGTYRENLHRQRAIDEYDVNINPVARGTGQFAGAFALPSGVARATMGGARAAMRAGAPRAAARTAARRAGARRLGVEGAAFGGAYGFGSSEGDIGDRLYGGAVSTIVGGGAGYGLGRGLGAVVDRYGRGGAVARNAERVEAADAADAAADLGLNQLPADVGTPLIRRLTAGMAQTPFGSGPIIRRARALEEGAGARLDELATEAGAPQRQEVFGETAQTAANRYIDESGTAGRQLYEGARELSNDVMARAPRAFRNLNSQLRELRPTEAVEGELPNALRRFRSVIADESGLQPLDIDAIRRLRTAVAAESRQEGLRGTDYKRRAGLVLDDLREDIVSQLPADAAAAFRQADDAWRTRLDTIDTVIEEVIGPAGERSAERVARRLSDLSRNDSLRFTRFLRDVPAQESNIIRGSIIQELGRARPGQQNAAGDRFSLETFLTNWNNLPERTRGVLFPTQGSRRAIENLAEVAAASRESRRYANTSNTGGSVNITERARALSYGAAWFTLGGSIIAENLTGRMLASPVLARWLARRPANPAAIRADLRKLSDIARTQPAIRTEVLGLQQALAQQLGTAGRSPATRAAAEDQEDVRRE
jgi:hypothetical protein